MPIPAIILLVTILVILGGVLFFNSQKRKIVDEKQNELAVIASLKIDNIVKWRMEHLRDGEILSNIIPLNRQILNFLFKDNPPELVPELYQRMKIFISNYDYHSIVLVDTSGSVRLVYPASETTPSFNASQIKEMNNPDIRLSDLHFSDDEPDVIHIDLQIPLFTAAEKYRVRAGTLLLTIDPRKSFYPLIQSWPTQSKSSETYIVRAEDDSVIFLNELRHKKNKALKFKMPFRDDLPASAAVTGHKGLFEGKDYRGIPVISYLTKIPDSPWFMVAKVDKQEIYSPLNELILFISIIAFLFILLISVSIIYLWRRQRIRYLRELNATRDKFFSIISHDLRSPFTGINGFASILVEDLEGKDLTDINVDEIKKHAGIIKSASQNAVDLLSNLTEWSRLNSGRLAFKPEEIDLVSLINGVVDLMNTAALQKSIIISKDIPSVLNIYADKEMISLVIRNLMSNSIKFTAPGGNIHISGLEKDNDIVVEVCDTGIGIKKEIIGNLFRLDENITTPGTQREHGTGLGLILVKEFISLHGGQVHVESEPGKFSRFSFTLPVIH